MTQMKTLVIALASVMAAGAASAASFDVRHEYKNSSEQHATRVKLGDSIGNFLVDIEAKFKGKNGEFLKDLQNNGWELGLNYRQKLNDNWTLTYGMPIEGRSSGMTYKPQLRATYSLESIEGLSLSARYRYDIRQNNTSDNERRHRLTGNINYSVDNWRFGLEANYYKADDYILYKDKETNTEYNSTVRYIIGQWAPYAEFGYSSYTKDDSFSGYNNDFELRSRIGVTYSF
ncbi:oligogalacturonate-specific porin KdgM family protein [Vibrio sp. YMD68]|uniref:oligogalacturonate-specific porin KdgM family protein n=1 Tax=Vibrio sp. YMD68 TaxID=3042300 RepID=UPI00249C4A4E|nr:oligogalacturonate-specific porin KdgM family protein [Vibrio sp. YMD68]WGV98281.1 oligogalacturonate-specific porin KdgM family protein [Vibrio sp. YMD68]